MAMGRVSFGGIVKKVCLAYTPDVRPGDYVVVHVGFAISRIDPREAEQMLAFVRETGELDEIERPLPRDAATPPEMKPV